jgi:uncharacterized metal-binding protein
MADEGGCLCGCDALVFSCSGAADVGEIADRAARRLDAEGLAGMSCMAGIGGHVTGLIESAKGASSCIVIDGCPLDSGRRAFDEAGVPEFSHVRVTDLGIVKGAASVDDSTIARVFEAAAGLLGGPREA